MIAPKSASILATFSLVLACSASAPNDSDSDRRGGDGDGTGRTDEPGDGNSGTIVLGEDGAGDDTGDGDQPLPDPSCSPQAIGRLRDYQSQGDIATCPVNQDFENPSWMDAEPDVGWLEPGIAAIELGADQKPLFSGGSFETVTSAATFNAWYRDDPDCNKPFEFEVPFETDPETGHLVFETDEFFPLDGQGYGNSAEDEISGKKRNFHFTFELHMTFLYSGGEIFNFRGDDDLFVFINNRLAIDLGGVHTPHEQSVKLDQLGLTKGQEYAIDFFHAERSATQSNFRIETSLKFTNCEPIIVVR